MSVIKDIESGKLELIVGKPDGLVSVNDDGLRSELLRLAQIGKKVQSARPMEEWHEDYRDVIWWDFTFDNTPYIGTPLDSEWIDGVYTHWTPLIVPELPKGESAE